MCVRVRVKWINSIDTFESNWICLIGWCIGANQCVRVVVWRFQFDYFQVINLFSMVSLASSHCRCWCGRNILIKQIEIEEQTIHHRCSTLHTMIHTHIQHMYATDISEIETWFMIQLQKLNLNYTPFSACALLPTLPASFVCCVSVADNKFFNHLWFMNGWKVTQAVFNFSFSFWCV